MNDLFSSTCDPTMRLRVFELFLSGFLNYFELFLSGAILERVFELFLWSVATISGPLIINIPL